jgi:protein-disulfide isomerase
VTKSRLPLIGGVIVAAAVVAVVVIVFAGRGGGNRAAATTTGAAPPPSAASLFAGIPQRGFELGRASAPNTLLVFEDPQCPYCRQWEEDALPSVVRDYVRTGRLKLDYRGVDILDRGNVHTSLKGLRVNYAAGEQNKLWDMAKALYDRQGEEDTSWLTSSVIRDAASAAHANADKILRALNSTAVTQAIGVATQEAQQIRLQGTPTFILQRPLQNPQELQVTGLDAQSFESTLASALQ